MCDGCSWQRDLSLGFSERGTRRCLARVRVECVELEHSSQRWVSQTVQYKTAMCSWFSSHRMCNCYKNHAQYHRNVCEIGDKNKIPVIDNLRFSPSLKLRHKVKMMSLLSHNTAEVAPTILRVRNSSSNPIHLRSLKRWDSDRIEFSRCAYSEKQIIHKFDDLPTGVGWRSKGQQITSCDGAILNKQEWQTVCPQYRSRGILSPCKVNTSSQTRHSKT